MIQFFFLFYFVESHRACNYSYFGFFPTLFSLFFLILLVETFDKLRSSFKPLFSFCRFRCPIFFIIRLNENARNKTREKRIKKRLHFTNPLTRKKRRRLKRKDMENRWGRESKRISDRNGNNERKTRKGRKTMIYDEKLVNSATGGDEWN